MIRCRRGVTHPGSHETGRRQTSSDFQLRSLATPSGSFDGIISNSLAAKMSEEDKGVCKKKDYAGPNFTDIYVEMVISASLGLSAFISFCVSSSLTVCDGAEPWSRTQLNKPAVDASPKMEDAVCSAQAAARSEHPASRPARHLLRMDTGSVQDNRGAGHCFGGP